MTSRPLDDATRERVRRAAAAARALDPTDREVLDMAHMGSDPDEATMRRLAADPLARDYAQKVVAGWRRACGSGDGGGPSVLPDGARGAGNL